MLGLTISGCAGLPSLPSLTSSDPVATQSTEPVAASEKMRVTRPLLLAGTKPTVGLPPAQQAQMAKDLNKFALKENVALLVDQGATPSINLQGYVTATRVKTSVKYTYVWHILSESGTRLGQFSGEEAAVVGPQDTDNWAAFTAVMSDRIAEKAIQGLVGTAFPNANATLAQTPAPAPTR